MAAGTAPTWDWRKPLTVAVGISKGSDTARDGEMEPGELLLFMAMFSWPGHSVDTDEDSPGLTGWTGRSRRSSRAPEGWWRMWGPWGPCWYCRKEVITQCLHTIF